MKNGDNLIHSFADAEAQGNYQGLTKREYFAGLVLQGICSNESWTKAANIPDDWDEYRERVCKSSIDLADELLKQLND
jgi:hypothetical protein